MPVNGQPRKRVLRLELEDAVLVWLEEEAERRSTTAPSLAAMLVRAAREAASGNGR